MELIELAPLMVAVALGAMGGAVLAWRVQASRGRLRHTQWVASARKHVQDSTQSLKAANARLQADLDREKLAARQRQAVVAADQRASVTRLEGQLRFSYAEIDRLNGERRDTGAGAGDGATDGHGFALTRPFER